MRLHILGFQDCIDLHVELSKCAEHVLQGGQKDIGAHRAPKQTGATTACSCCLSPPLQPGWQNWFKHAAAANLLNVLTSCNSA